MLSVVYFQCKTTWNAVNISANFKKSRRKFILGLKNQKKCPAKSWKDCLTVTRLTWQSVVCFTTCKKSLVLINFRVQGSGYDDDDDDDGRWGVGKGVCFKSGHGLCPMLDPNPFASRIMLCGISEIFPFLCRTSTLYNDGPAAGQTNWVWWRGWTRGQGGAGVRTHRGSIWITLHLLELHFRSGRKFLFLHHINAAWIFLITGLKSIMQ